MPEGEPIMMGMFPVVKHPTVMLFDSGASHTFINKTFVMKHDIPIGETKENFHIHSGAYRVGGSPSSHIHANSKGSRYRCDPGYELDASAWSCDRHSE
jgi:hypothetical protein